MLCYSHLFIPLKYLVFAQVFFFIHSSRGQIDSGERHCTALTSQCQTEQSKSQQEPQEPVTKATLRTLTVMKGLDPQVVEALHVHGLVVEVVEVRAAHPR